MTTKAQLIDAILNADPKQDKTKLLKSNKTVLAALLESYKGVEVQPEAEEKQSPTGAMAALREARKGYQELTRKDGGKSLGCGDPVQQALLAYGPADLKDLATIADDLLGLCKATKSKPEQTHWDRYSHLNNGQIRMNIGNKLRGGLKKGNLIMDGDVLKRA